METSLLFFEPQESYENTHRKCSQKKSSMRTDEKFSRVYEENLL